QRRDPFGGARQQPLRRPAAFRRVLEEARHRPGRPVRQRPRGAGPPAARAQAGLAQARGELPDRLAMALGALPGRVRLQLSGRDLTAAEFEIAMTRAGLADCLADAWRLAQADHTFSDPAHWEAAIDDTLAWLARIAPIVR